MIDIGANLTHDSFAADLPEVIERAKSAGLDRIVVTGADARSNRQALILAREYPDILFATAGIHPHYAAECSDETIAQLRVCLKEPKIVALGEAGLDFHRDFCPRPRQKHVFESLLELGVETGMPLFAHERDAAREMREMLRDCRDRLGPVVIHCFTGDRDALHGYLDLDCHIGITGWFCDERRGKHLHSLVADIPDDRLMLETDAPYLLPRDLKDNPNYTHLRVAMKSGRNEPCALPHIIERVAAHLPNGTSTLASRATSTAERFFDIS